MERIRSERSLSRYSSPRIVYVLSGVAATGFCHLGMIESLEKRGIRPNLVIGTSAGALLGALYSHFGNIEDVFGQVQIVLASDEFKEFERKYFGKRKPADGHVQSGIRHFLVGLAGTLKNGMHLGKAMVASAMVAEKDAVSIFSKIFEGITFQTLKVPFAAVAVDLVEGAPVILTAAAEASDRGTVRTIPGPNGLMKAVMASSAIPLISAAVEIGGHARYPRQSNCPRMTFQPWNSSSGSSTCLREANNAPTGSSSTSCFSPWTGPIRGPRSLNIRSSSAWDGGT
jgi:predicted acylesterase/phospholipase RssA